MLIKKDYIDGDYRIIEYENGTVLRQAIEFSNNEDMELPVPKSPIIEIEEKQVELEKSLMEISMMLGGML